MWNIGDKFELEVMELCSNYNGRDYILALGPDDLSYKINNIIKCQYTSLPNTIYGEVVGFESNGKARVRQDEQRVYQEHYALGKFYPFTISDQDTDKNNKNFYDIEDDFACQRWYSEDSFEIGDTVILEAKSITKNGYIYYCTHKSYVPEPPAQEDRKKEVVASTGNLPVFAGPDEGPYVEYKTSIVFYPKTQQPDVDAQCLEITKELAAFMNAEGGTLYIGIHDKTREIVGYEDDLQYLNMGESEYAGSYTPDDDHYQLKIRDMLVQYTSSTAGSLIKVCIEEQDGAKYCKVDVSPASFPVWVKGCFLYERQGNQKRMLRGDAITHFICRRLANVIQSPNEIVVDDSFSKKIETAVYKAINDRRKEVSAGHVEQPKDKKAKYWIVWKQDGTYSKKSESQNGSDVFKQLPVTDDTSSLIVAFCHKSGTLNTVKLGDFMKGVTLKKAGKNGFNPNELPTEIFVCHSSALLAIYSADSGGTEFIKIHHITDVNPTKSSKNAGSYIIPTSGGHVLKYKLLSPVQADRASALIVAKKETLTFGKNIYDIQFTKEIEYLNGL